MDRSATPDILPRGESVPVYATGGRTPGMITWKTSSAQTRWSNGRQTMVTTSPSATLTASESFCGHTVITISDGCSEVKDTIRSDVGTWVDAGDTCLVSDDVPLPCYGCTGYYPTSYTVEVGGYRTTESISYVSFSCYGGCVPSWDWDYICACHCGEYPADADTSTCLGWQHYGHAEGYPIDGQAGTICWCNSRAHVRWGGSACSAGANWYYRSGGSYLRQASVHSWRFAC